jgi:hypothetical protein
MHSRNYGSRGAATRVFLRSRQSTGSQGDNDDVRWQILFICAIGACQQAHVSPQPAPTAEQREALRRDHSGERSFQEISEKIPSFAGYYYRRGTNILVVNVTDMAASDSARALVDRLFSDPIRIGPAGRAQVVVQKVKFTYWQFATWRGSADKFFLRTPGVESVDLDESANKLNIGVTTPEARKSVETIMRRLKVPPDAYVTHQAKGQIEFDRDR